MNLGILLMNTGTADEPTEEAIARYLHQFLMDPAIIAAPIFVRKPLVDHICRSRPRYTLPNYQEFWTAEGSPFILAMQRQRDALEVSLRATMGASVTVALGMRYGNPDIQQGLAQLREAGCDTVMLLPSYPQQVNVCAGTCIKEARAVLKALAKDGWKPQVMEVPHFYHQPSYQAALIESVRSAWTYKPGSKLLVSFHSTLLKDIEQGDRYLDQASATRDFLAAGLGIPAEDAILVFQSRFDSRKWLQPFTEPTVRQLAEQGVKDLCILCPIFTAECIETGIEINRDLRATFLEAAGEGATFTYVPALNDAEGLIEALATVVCETLDGQIPQVQMPEIKSDTSLPGHLHGQVRRALRK